MNKIYTILLFSFLFCCSLMAQHDSRQLLPYVGDEGSLLSVNTIASKKDSQDPKKQAEVFSGDIKIMPNPATDFFKIDTKEKIAEVQVINMLGRVVKQFKANHGDYFDITGLTSGVYFVKIDHAESNKSRTLRIKVN